MKTFTTLTYTQNQDFQSLYDFVKTKYKINKSNRFLTKNNQLRYTDRIMSGVNNYTSISNFSSDIDLQIYVSSIFIKSKINNLSLVANALVKIAYLCLFYSQESNKFTSALSAVHKYIEEEPLLQLPDTTNLKTAISNELIIISEQLFVGNVLTIISWLKAKLSLVTSQGIEDINTKSTDFDASNITQIQSILKSLELFTINDFKNTLETLPGYFVNSSANQAAQSILTDIVNNKFNFIEEMSGSTDNEIDSIFNSKLKSPNFDVESLEEIPEELFIITENAIFGPDIVDSQEILKNIILSFLLGFLSSGDI